MIRRENWLMTEEYLKELKDSISGKSADTVARYEFSLRPLLYWAGELPFEEAFSTQEVPFSAYVSKLPARRGDGILAAESQKKIVIVSKVFLEWAIEKKLINTKRMPTDAISKMVYPKILPSAVDPVSVSVDEVKRIASIDVGNDLAMIRNKAVMCFAFLSGARADAIASAPISSINLDKREFSQLTELGVRTKNSKSAITYLLNIPELLSAVREWDDIVRKSLPSTGLWFSPLESKWGAYTFSQKSAGIHRASALVDQFRTFYEKVGMADQYKSPHKYRHGFAVFALSNCRSMADYQAVSRNLMHSSLTVTDKIYAVIEREDRKKRIDNISQIYMPTFDDELVNHLSKICPEDRARAIQILAGKLVEG